ncbi:hypothetical protein BDV36DRAFT_297309 [Aspergillus pseudocaelatus]|uniref:Uncharacterized protein n=1 Tax=Aspergillus pseudocaelatus TaxID=1825620 RepID=A0ABQ6WGC4_9EURO|nr:hypothetical protein BDV36DRAFT_297309 [Aspergillus pseudocaelatus]
MRLKAITSVPAQEKDKDQESLKGMAWQAVNNCQSLDLPAVSQNSQKARSAIFNTPDLTDSLSGCSSPSTTSSTFGTVAINPRILEAPSALLRQPVEETEQPYTRSPRVYMESNYAAEKIEGNTPLQQPFTDLARAKAKEQAAKTCQRSTDFQISGRKARPYSQAEDKLLKTLIQKLATFEAVMLAFQKRFPGQSAISLRNVGRLCDRCCSGRPN